MEKASAFKAYDHRVEQFIDMTDKPFIEKACKLLNVRYEPLFNEGEEYYRSDGTSIFVPDGKAWIKMRANLPAGKGFNFVFEKAEELKKQS